MKMDYVIVGHSERRQIFNETNSILSQKFNLAHQHNLIPVLCVGETFDERKNDQTIRVIETQIQSIIENTNPSLFANSIIAYEPVWAIGTGKTASPEQAQAVHLFIRSLLGENNENIAQNTPILYGGSMNAGNANELIACADIDGGLIGGAALKAEDFLQICKAG